MSADIPNELGTITLTCNDGDSWRSVLSGMDDFLVEVESHNGELDSGYVTVTPEAIELRAYFQRPSACQRIEWDTIARIEVQ